MSQAIVVDDPAFKNVVPGKLGMWLFIVMDALSFGTILIGASYLRANGAPWHQPGEVLNIGLTAFNTLLLMISSYTMMNALDAIRQDDRKRFVNHLLLTLLLGAAFLGIQAYEYCHLIKDGFLPSSGQYQATFFGATGYHGIHVLAGLVFIAYVLIRALKGGFSSQNHTRVETLTLYWHFVDLMWMLVFTVVYLI